MPKVVFTYNYILSLYQYYIQRLKTSRYYKFILSKVYGISVAEKFHHTLKISYFYEGQMYTLHVPYERKLESRMMNQNVLFHYPNETMELRQQPGIPYLITPRHLDASHAILYDIDGEKHIDYKERIDVL